MISMFFMFYTAKNALDVEKKEMAVENVENVKSIWRDGLYVLYVLHG